MRIVVIICIPIPFSKKIIPIIMIICSMKWLGMLAMVLLLLRMKKGYITM